MGTHGMLAFALGVTLLSISCSQPVELHVVGFRQGKKQLVSCATDSQPRGLEITSELMGPFADPVIASFRLICDSGKISVDGAAPVPDTTRFGPGQLSKKLEATCPTGTKLVGLKWRLAKQTTSCEKRAAGVTLICEGPTPSTAKELRLDHAAENPGTQHQFNVLCKGSSISTFYVWWNHWEFNGFEVAACAKS